MSRGAQPAPPAPFRSQAKTSQPDEAPFAFVRRAHWLLPRLFLALWFVAVPAGLSLKSPFEVFSQPFFSRLDLDFVEGTLTQLGLPHSFLQGSNGCEYKRGEMAQKNKSQRLVPQHTRDHDASPFELRQVFL